MPTKSNFGLPLMIITLYLLSCSKSDNIIPDEPDYYGTYTSTGGDTAYLSSNNTYLKIRWCALGNSGKINFDSVKLNNDNTFTVNQWITYGGGQSAIGSGIIANNTVQFNFTIGGNGHINFSGIKR
jgi:hypothetical protein